MILLAVALWLQLSGILPAALALDPCSCPGFVGGPAGACGSVRDLRSGRPIVGASVNAGRPESAQTEADGCFSVAGQFSGACAYLSPECAPHCILDCPIDVSASAPGYEGSGFHGYFNTFPLLVGFRLAPLAAISCAGDCDGDGAVFIDEILCRVRATLGSSAAACGCEGADGAEAIAGLVDAIENALLGCLDCVPGSCSRFD